MDISIFLKPLSIQNVTPFYTWLNDPEAIKYSLSLFQSLNTKENIDEWYISVINDSKITIGGFFFSIQIFLFVMLGFAISLLQTNLASILSL